MDALHFMKEMLSEPALQEFISEHVPADMKNYNGIYREVGELHKYMKSRKFMVLAAGDEKQALIKNVRLTAAKVGMFVSEIVGRASGKQSSSSNSHDDLVKNWKKTLDLIFDMLDASNYSEHQAVDDQLRNYIIEYKNMVVVENIEKMLLEMSTADSSNCAVTLNEEQSRALFLKKAFPNLGESMNRYEIRTLYYELSNELDNLPHLICKAFEGQSLALLLIGCLLSFKPIAYNTWNRVKDDLVKIKESNGSVTSNYMCHIYTYCYDDLPYFLKPCFLYFACYPIGYEIPATSLTDIWIAEGFVTSEEGETIEETANKYLQQLVQRSLVFVSKRSLLGTIKSCRVHRSIHKFAIQQSYMDGFLVPNPDQQEIEYLIRLAIHQDNMKQYTEVKNNHIHSFLAFNFDRNVLGSTVLLRVLALRNSTIPITALPNMINLRYLGLWGSTISVLPINIGDMKNLETLDVRDTSIETLPESLWNIKKLRHVYVKSSPQNKGPPSAANISDLQILKTVAAHESWAENIPHFLIHLRKLQLSNLDNLDWKSISNLLSHMDKLISMAIIGKIIPSEFVDTRAFPNLETVKSIKFEGIWNCRKLFIDNVKFPPNLTKLTLANSGLKEDPMPTLERLQALKSLSLKDGAYTGKQMVCSADGFPQLQFLELSKLENLEIWEVELPVIIRLSTLRIAQCPKFKSHHDLELLVPNFSLII